MQADKKPLVTYIRLSGYVAASPATAPATDDSLWKTPIYGVLTTSLRPNALLMQVVGNSMDDGTLRSIPHGSLVLVDTHDLAVHQMRRGYLYMFVTPDGAAIAKKYDLYHGDSVPDNSGSARSWRGEGNGQELQVRLHPTG